MDLGASELRDLVRRAIAIKERYRAGDRPEPLRGKALAMIFDKSSTRTRVSFETAMIHFGGHAIFLAPGDSQLGRGEPVEDTARVLSGMVDAVVIRTGPHEMVETFAAHSSVPVINGLTDRFHPCQLLADIQTYVEHRGDVRGITAAWIGDGNNVCHSWMNAAQQFDFRLRVATPRGFGPDPELLAERQAHVTLMEDPAEAADGAAIVVTDTWASMGQESEKAERLGAFEGFRVDEAIMKQARDDALFMHCLPAYRGNEVTASVIDGPQSVVWDQAENRLHAQKALLELLLAA